MRALLAVSSLVAVLGVVSTSLWRDLRHERQVNREITSQLSDARAISRIPVPAPGPAPVVVAKPASAVVATSTIAAPACTPVSDEVRLAAAAANANRTATTSVQERDLLKDPEYRKARLAQRRLNLQLSNPGVAEALGMSERDADKFLDLLAENQVRMTELPVIDAGSPQATAAENTRRQQAMQRQQEESVAALLGASGNAQWQDYQKTRGARSQVVSIGSQLLQVGLPLTNAQMKPMTTALIAEQQRQQQEQQTFGRGINPQDPQARAQAQEASRQREAESNRRLLAALAPSLNPQQLAMLRNQFETAETMNQVSVRARERAIAARGQPQTQPPGQ